MPATRLDKQQQNRSYLASKKMFPSHKCLIGNGWCLFQITLVQTPDNRGKHDTKNVDHDPRIIPIFELLAFPPRLALAYPEELRSAHTAGTLGGGASVLERYLLRPLNLSLRPALHAIRFHLLAPYDWFDFPILSRVVKHSKPVANFSSFPHRY